ncbi:polyprenyl synthetase family protein [Streptomyces sp. SRF1]|uniref:polyprenyl synthetase family protein n=1 Tax=Streptomyces sp. SRF1 TaxID=1549642 RepID=UPI0025AF2B69|nr:polyprenyl synthetase family protein [Streptomyces sp. SRF1]MDN3059386.1 polyprenyl synthetase family protein [Streptomyces sp. SRF1]
MPLPSDEDLIRWQQQLEQSLARFADTDLRQATARISHPAVHDAAAAYLIRPSKRLLGMAFLHAAHTLSADADAAPEDLTAIATALEIRHGAILLHDDIVDGDTVRGGHPTAHRALAHSFGAEARSAALFAGDILAGLAPLPLLRSGLPDPLRVRLTDLFQHTTALVAAGQTEQLDLDTRKDALEVTEADILRVHGGQFGPYLLCSLQLAAALAGLDHSDIDRITRAGLPLCQGFQVQNDLAGYTELARVLSNGDTTEGALTLANTSDLARRRRTVPARTALSKLTGPDRDRLVDYFTGAEMDLIDVCALMEKAEVTAYCASLVNDLHAHTRDRITADPGLPAPVRTALSATCTYMTALYDPASPTSRLYLNARPDLQLAS